MSTQEDIDAMLRKVDGRLAGHAIPPGELVFRAPGSLDTEAMPEPDLSTEAGLRRFVRAEVYKALDELAQEFREHRALRAFPRAEGTE